MHPILHRAGREVLDLIAPNLCPSCDEPLAEAERFYCGACRASLDPAPYPREIFSELADRFPGDELALGAAGALYSFGAESPVRRLVHAVKYEGCYRLGVELGRELGAAIGMFREFENVEMIIPVPLHGARRRERGYNQAEAIAEGLASATGRRALPSAIERTRHTRSQTALDAATRRRNMSRLFRTTSSDAREAIRNRIILLCDDVCTTGATLNACAEALLAAGARGVLAAAVAKD